MICNTIIDIVMGAFEEFQKLQPYQKEFVKYIVNELEKHVRIFYKAPDHPDLIYTIQDGKVYCACNCNGKEWTTSAFPIEDFPNYPETPQPSSFTEEGLPPLEPEQHTPIESPATILTANDLINELIRIIYDENNGDGTLKVHVDLSTYKMQGGQPLIKEATLWNDGKYKEIKLLVFSTNQHPTENP